MIETLEKLFPLGSVRMTETAGLQLIGSNVERLLEQHQSGSWDLPWEDKEANDKAIKENKGRILSTQQGEFGPKVIVCTDLGKQATAVMLMHEFPWALP